jgi:Zn-dependent protease
MADLSPTIGKILGIRVELHWSFLLLLVFILFLSLYFFVLWVLLFACVLVHELVHSVTSRRNGIKVNKIVLYPFGGGSIIDFEKVNPETEFKISIVGPIASLLLAAIFGIINIYTPVGMVRTTLQTLFILNLFLGVFNLLPWLPLDGGRALRSYLQRKRNFLDATRVAVLSSNIITVLFVGGTIIFAVLAQGYTLTYREFIVVWDVAIAMFIYSGARYELQSAFIKENIKGMKVMDATTKNFIVVSGKSSISDLYNTILKNRTSIILFKSGTDVRLLSSAALQKLLNKTHYEGRIETFGVQIPTAKYNEKLYPAIERMRAESSSIAAVMKNSSIVGVLLASHAESIIALHISKKKQN